MAEVLPITSPDIEAMRKHVRHLFWYEFRDGEYDGLIELAWTDAADHKLRHARLFGLDEIDLLLEEAVKINSVPQQNVYLGAALRGPDTARSQRAADKDFYSLKCVYADLDEQGAAKAAEGKYHGVKPTMVIITGTDPHYRAHLYFRLQKPISDPQEVRETLGLTAENFNGDPAVTNPSRVMRLGGSIAWPIKKGRQIEMTEVITFEDDRPVELPATALQAAWKRPAPAEWDVGNGSGIDADSCVAEIQKGRNLHINTRNLVAKRVGQGIRDQQIIEEVETLLRPVSDGGTLDQVGKFIESARTKYNVREPEPVVTNLIIAKDWQGVDPAPREWVVEGWVPKGHVTGFYGNGGIGKTLLAQQLLTSVATGDQWVGMDVEQTKAFGFFCEDYENDIHITQQAICREYGITMNSLPDLAFMSRVGEDNILMSFDKNGVGVLTPLFYELLTAIKDYGAKFIVIDTLADTFGGEENNRPQARQFVANCLGRLARETGGTTMVCAHPSIAGMASGEGYGGSTAWNNTFRSRMYLSRPDDDHDDDPDLRTLERKKANYASTGEPLLLRWSDGVLGLSDNTRAGTRDNLSMDLARQILTEIDAKWRDERPYALAKNTGQRYAVRMMMTKFKLRKMEAEKTLHSWWQNGVVGEDIVSKKTKLKGLKVTKWI